MRVIWTLITLTLALGIRVRATVSEEDCFRRGATRAVKIANQSQNKEFIQEMEKLKDSSFLTVVRYCLGEDASTSSQDFVSCLLALNACQRGTMDLVHWEPCVCDTAHCILRNCLVKWVSTMSISDLSCLKPCLSENAQCIVSQTGALGKAPVFAQQKA